MTQIADAIICKTRKNSIFQQVGTYVIIFPFPSPSSPPPPALIIIIIIIYRYDVTLRVRGRAPTLAQGMHNWVLNAGLIFAVLMGCFILYTPGMDEYFMMPPIRAEHWLPGLPFAFIIILFDEVRRYILRKRPGGWVEREFYY